MYHAWKSKNKKRNTETEQRAPKSVTDYGKNKSVLFTVLSIVRMTACSYTSCFFSKIVNIKFSYCDLVNMIQS